MKKESNNAFEKKNRFDRTVDIKLSVTEEDIVDTKVEDKQIDIDKPYTDQVESTSKTTIVDGKANTEIEIIKPQETVLSTLTNLKSNELISKIVKKSKEKDELAELMAMFPNMKKNEVVALFAEEILKQREKEIRKKMMGYKSKKTKSFKERHDTFSMPVRPEMKELLNMISLFSGSNKYLFFEDFIIHACKTFDFDKELDDEE